MGHGWALYEELVHTPLLFWHPRLRDLSKRIAAPVSLVDVMPTLLELVGAEGQASDIDGRSLVPCFQNDVIANADERILYSELGEVRSADRERESASDGCETACPMRAST